MKQLQYIDIIALCSEMRPQKMKDSAFNHQRVIESDVPGVVDTVPACMPAAGYALVHDVVDNEEAGLELHRSDV